MTDIRDSAIAPTGRIANGSNGMTLRHVVESQQFTVPLLMELFDRSRGMERVVARGGSLDFQKKIMATVFYQPSTRTRFSFEADMHRLGGSVLSTEHARAFSSEVEGEQVEDSIRIIGSYSDVIVIRHHVPVMLVIGGVRGARIKMLRLHDDLTTNFLIHRCLSTHRAQAEAKGGDEEKPGR